MRHEVTRLKSMHEAWQGCAETLLLYFRCITGNCSIVLMHLKDKNVTSIYFKGGTLLAKGYANFYRLSEDLDFGISISPLATRQQRSKLAKPLKEVINSIVTELPFLRIKIPLTGSNKSRQYNCELLIDRNRTSRRSCIPTCFSRVKHPIKRSYQKH